MRRFGVMSIARVDRDGYDGCATMEQLHLVANGCADPPFHPKGLAMKTEQTRREWMKTTTTLGLAAAASTTIPVTVRGAARDEPTAIEIGLWPESFIRPGIQRPGSWFYGVAQVRRDPKALRAANWTQSGSSTKCFSSVVESPGSCHCCVWSSSS